MSSNDAIVLRANFEAWRTQRAAGLSDVDPWLYYAVSQYVKPFDLNDEEILYGLTDSGNDGGADAIYLIVNRRILITDDTTIDPKIVNSVRILIMQAKTSGGFKPTEIDKHIEFASDFFDLSKMPASLSFRYNFSVLAHMVVFQELFLKISGNFPTIHVDFYYITGDDVAADGYATDSAERVKDRVGSHLSKSIRDYHFAGAQELWEQVQKRPQRNKVLRWAGTPMETREGFVGLVNLRTYYSFLQDEPGVLAERIFESNVRGYQRDSSVNSQIKASLEEREKQINFWILNNGVTVLAAEGTGSAGHLALNINDPQIVNGLQTSREIFNYFRNDGENGTAVRKDEPRSILVRVLVISDPAAQDAVIKATNSQNRMMPASLRMTDQIHRDIEELFKTYNLYYDRRKGFYRDQGRPIKQIVTVNALVQAVISVMLQKPDDARARPGDYFKDERRYDQIFGGRYQLPVYLRCIGVLRRVEAFLEAQNVSSADAKNIKFHMATDLACELAGSSRIWSAKMVEIPDPASADDAVIRACFDRIKAMYDELAKTADRDAVARGTEFVTRLLVDIKARFPLPARRERLRVSA